MSIKRCSQHRLPFEMLTAFSVWFPRLSISFYLLPIFWQVLWTLVSIFPPPSLVMSLTNLVFCLQLPLGLAWTFVLSSPTLRFVPLSVCWDQGFLEWELWPLPATKPWRSASPCLSCPWILSPCTPQPAPAATVKPTRSWGFGRSGKNILIFLFTTAWA